MARQEGSSSFLKERTKELLPLAYRVGGTGQAQIAKCFGYLFKEEPLSFVSFPCF
jgi:hypothetical protein